MSLDLEDIIAGWDRPLGEVAARMTDDDTGQQFVQLRIDLGVLQIHLEGRPDGSRYHGLPSALDYIRHELRFGRDNISGEHWAALDREMAQLNYRRVACMTIAEDALRRNDELTAREFINRVVHDIDQCRGVLRLIVAHQGHLGRHAELLPTLMFNRARLLSQLRTLERDFDAAIDAAEDGADELRQVLEDFGVIEEADSENVGVVYLRELGRHLRAQHAVALTLRERLQVAIDNEDYEAAASLHDELRQRNRRRRPARGLLPPA